jgi:hypothetical protein
MQNIPQAAPLRAARRPPSASPPAVALHQPVPLEDDYFGLPEGCILAAARSPAGNRRNSRRISSYYTDLSSRRSRCTRSREI